ncbi:PHD finger protein 11 [Apodemus speciosus]|uniref:PHD finger protein 11 n=1 Tax=Apodemus speciosus TaxID=105296 RepID=A0ABQ0FID7_APOSI
MYFAQNILHNKKRPLKVMSTESPSMKKRRGRKKRLSPGSPAQPKMMKFMRSKRRMTGEPLRHRDAAVKAPFLKKCQEAGLLTELFEQILEKMESIHGRFMDETASESDYEGIETLLFGCGLFKDTLRKFQEVKSCSSVNWIKPPCSPRSKEVFLPTLHTPVKGSNTRACAHPFVES